MKNVGDHKNSFAITSGAFNWQEGKTQLNVVPTFGEGDVVGCGVLADADGKYVELFYTKNGEVVGQWTFGIWLKIKIAIERRVGLPNN